VSVAHASAANGATLNLVNGANDLLSFFDWYGPITATVPEPAPLAIIGFTFFTVAFSRRLRR